MKLLLHNFKTTLKRQRLYSMCNIIGLAIAFAVVIVISIQLSLEFNYGKTDPNYNEIFRVEIYNEPGNDRPGYIDSFLTEQLTQNEPRVENYFGGDDFFQDITVSSSKDGGFISSYNYNCYTPINVFTFTMLEGSKDAVNYPDKAIIPLSLAQKLFPNSSAMGKQLYIKDSWDANATDEKTVGGVYKDFEANSGFKNSIFGQANFFEDEIFKHDIYLPSLYIQTANNKENLTAIMDNLMAAIDKMDDNIFSKAIFKKANIKIVPIGDIYFSNCGTNINPMFETSSRDTTNLMFYIALLILVIAVVNFINLSTALATKRLRSLNTRFVFGESKAMLRRSIIGEAVGFSLIAYLIALVLVLAVPQSPFMQLLTIQDVSLSGNLSVVVIAGVAALLIGVIAGIYPAYYSTRFSAAMALKTSNGGSRSGSRLRIVLISLQTTISVILIIYSLFIYYQNYYLINGDQGFDKEGVASLNIAKAKSQTKKVIIERLLTNPNIEYASLVAGTIGKGEGMRSQSNKKGTRELITLRFICADSSLFNVLGVSIVEGRNFIGSDKKTAMIVNQTMQRKYDIKVDSVFEGREVVGVCEDFVTHSMREPVSDMGFVNDQGFAYTLYLRMNLSNLVETVDYIKEVCAELNPEQAFEFTFMDDFLSSLYEKEQRYSMLISVLSLIAIIITLIGIMGLIIFEMEYKRKEIALRKIHGATVKQIMRMILKRYFLIISTATVIAIPIAYYLIDSWLTSFAFHVSITPLLFIIGVLVIFTAIGIVVATLTIKSARSNPIDLLED